MSTSRAKSGPETTIAAYCSTHGRMKPGVAEEPAQHDAVVEPHHVALAQHAPRARDPVHDLLVDGDAERGGVAVVAGEGGGGAEGAFWVRALALARIKRCSSGS